MNLNKAAYDNMKQYQEELATYEAKRRKGQRFNGKEWVDTLTLDDLIKMCREDTWRWFPQVSNDLTHMVLALNEEAGEVAGALKKGQRGSLDYDKAIEKLSYETIDVLIYLCNIWGILNADPVELYYIVQENNEARFGAKNA